MKKSQNIVADKPIKEIITPASEAYFSTGSHQSQYLKSSIVFSKN